MLDDVKLKIEFVEITRTTLSKVMVMDREEQLFTIQQLSLKLKIPRPTLRFWEKELNGIIIPLRTQGGQRRYTAENVSIIKEIRRLRTKGLSLVEIRRKLNNRRKTVERDSKSQRIDLLVDRISEIIRSEIYGFFQRENID